MSPSDAGHTEEIRIWNQPDSSSFINGVFSWTPRDYEAGMYNISFSTFEPATQQTVFKTLRIVVADTDFSIRYNKLFEYLFTATDPDNDNVEITVQGLPAGATWVGGQFSPKIFSWTPTRKQIGNHQMIVTATDYPPGGQPKQDISIIKIKVTKLSADETTFDHFKDDQIDLADLGMFAANWMKGVPIPPPPDPNTIVYTTESGTRFHKEDCSYLAGSLNIQETTIEECQADGITPCSRCRPLEIQYSSYAKLTEDQKKWIEEHDGMTPEEVLNEALSELMGRGDQKVAPKNNLLLQNKSLEEIHELLVEEWLSQDVGYTQ